MKETAEHLLPIERKLFFALNGSDSIFLDNLFWTFTGRYVWAPLLLFLAVMLFYKVPRREGALAIVFFIMLFVVCDQVSSGLFKPLFERFRPTHHPDFQNLVDTVNGYRGGTYGFISGHATNSFGLSAFFSLVFKKRWVVIPIFIWAIINSYSRIYLGVHFVSDVAVGAVVGALLAWMLYELYSWVRFRFYHVSKSKSELSVYSAHSCKIIGFVISIYILSIIILSPFLAILPH